jgi:putative peptide zinc metalloprotease protein
MTVTGPAAPAELAPADLGALIVLVLASMLIHELGHATACTRFGCPHGEVGWGVYLYLPMLYTDVTRAWRLSPQQRSVVDLGGLYFQAIIIPPVAFWAWYSGSHIAQGVVWINVYMMLHALNPMFKMDGYWLLTDLSGLTNLHRRAGAALKAGLSRLVGRPVEARDDTGRVRTAVLNAYTVMCLVYFAFVIYMLSTNAPRVLAAYPATAARHLGSLGDALGAGAAGGAAGSLLSLLASTVPPAIVCLASYYIGRRIFWLLTGAAFKAWRLARAASLHTANPTASA